MHTTHTLHTLHIHVHNTCMCAGESVLFVVMSRQLQDLLLRDAEPFVRAVIGIMAQVSKQVSK